MTSVKGLHHQVAKTSHQYSALTENTLSRVKQKILFIKIYLLNRCNYSGAWYAVIECREKKRLNLTPSPPSTLISQKFRLSLQSQHLMMILKPTKILLSFWQCINWNWKIFCGEQTLNSDLSLKHSSGLLIILLRMLGWFTFISHPLDLNS